MHKKKKGRQYIHFVQSFREEENVTEKEVKKIAEKMLEQKKFEGFQVVYAVHNDTKNLHTHFVINTVNIDTGKKWQMSKEDLESMKKYSDKLCKEKNMHVVKGKKKERKGRGEYRSKEKGNSYKYELFKEVSRAKKKAGSKKEFIKLMEAKGYKVRWEEERKYITFTTPEGKKVRNNRLVPSKEFTKEEMEKIFELNAQGRRKEKKKEVGRNIIKCGSENKKANRKKWREGEKLKEEESKEEKKNSMAERKKGKGIF